MNIIIFMRLITYFTLQSITEVLRQTFIMHSSFINIYSINIKTNVNKE